MLISSIVEKKNHYHTSQTHIHTHLTTNARQYKNLSQLFFPIFFLFCFSVLFFCCLSVGLFVQAHTKKGHLIKYTYPSCVEMRIKHSNVKKTTTITEKNSSLENE